MITSLDDLSSLDHDDIIRMSNGLESMRDDDDGSSFEERIECCGDLLF